jgi:Methyltransferase domain
MVTHGCFSFAEFYEWVARDARINAAVGDRSVDGSWRGVEVGALHGQSARYLAEALRRAWPGRSTLDVVELSDNREILRANLADVADVAGTIGDIHSPCFSLQAATMYDAASLDFVFLDADHSYEGVSADIAAWTPKVKRGGIIAGHDFCHYFPGVIRAVLERFPQVNVWRGTEWPDEHVPHDGRREAAEEDFRKRSAHGGCKDYLASWWVKI